MEETNTNIFNKKNMVSLLIVGIMLLVIPVGVKLVSEQQLLKSRAASDPVIFTGTNVSSDKRTTSSTTVTVELRSPLGPPIESSQSSGTQ